MSQSECELPTIRRWKGASADRKPSCLAVSLWFGCQVTEPRLFRLGVIGIKGWSRVFRSFLPCLKPTTLTYTLTISSQKLARAQCCAGVAYLLARASGAVYILLHLIRVSPPGPSRRLESLEAMPPKIAWTKLWDYRSHAGVWYAMLTEHTPDGCMVHGHRCPSHNALALASDARQGRWVHP